jgi:tetratricopeptide (TPR) repeat protein
MKCLGRKWLRKAAKGFRSIQRSNPSQQFVDLAESAMSKKDWAQAITHWQESIRTHRGSTPVSFFIQLSKAYRNQSDFDAAEALTRQAMALFPSSVKLAREFAEISMSREDWSEAVIRWQTVLELCGDVVPLKIYIRLSHAYFQQDAFADAEASLNKALQVEPNSLSALIEKKNQVYKRSYFTQLMERTQDCWSGSDASRNYFEKASLYCKRLLPLTSGKKHHKIVEQFIKAQLNLAEKRWSIQDRDGANTIVHDTLKTLDQGLPRLLMHNLLGAVEAARSGVEHVSAVQNELIQQLSDVNASTLSSSVWLGMYDIMVWNGLLRSGLAAREKAVTQAYAQARSRPGNTTCLIGALRAAIDRSHFSAAEEFLFLLTKADADRQTIAELTAYYHLNRGDTEQFRKQWPHRIMSIAEKRFHDYIEGKSVAIVGPAPNGEPHGEVIDAFDVVVRFNYFGPNYMPDPDEFGKRINISYYSVGNLRIAAHQNRDLHLSELDFYVFKKQKHTFLQAGLTQGNAKQLTINRNFFYKVPNLMPAALFDLLLYNPGIVKIFKSNFYLSSQPYETNYLNKVQLKTQQVNKIQKMTSVHDPLCQLSFTRNLWESGRIAADKCCEDVLKRTDEAYMTEMEKIYLNG